MSLNWPVTAPDPQLKLLWFCVNPQGEAWVEVTPVEPGSDDAILTRVKGAIRQAAGPRGEITFAGDSTPYLLKRVELRAGVKGPMRWVLYFDKSLVQGTGPLKARLWVYIGISAERKAPRCIDRGFQETCSLEYALAYCESMIRDAAAAGGIVHLDQTPALLDRIEIYRGEEFVRVFTLDYGDLFIVDDEDSI